jgi:hypothetical protein
MDSIPCLDIHCSQSLHVKNNFVINNFVFRLFLGLLHFLFIFKSYMDHAGMLKLELLTPKV